MSYQSLAEAREAIKEDGGGHAVFYTKPSGFMRAWVFDNAASASAQYERVRNSPLADNAPCLVWVEAL